MEVLNSTSFRGADLVTLCVMLGVRHHTPIQISYSHVMSCRSKFQDVVDEALDCDLEF